MTNRHEVWSLSSIIRKKPKRHEVSFGRRVIGSLLWSQWKSRNADDVKCEGNHSTERWIHLNYLATEEKTDDSLSTASVSASKIWRHGRPLWHSWHEAGVKYSQFGLSARCFKASNAQWKTEKEIERKEEGLHFVEFFESDVVSDNQTRKAQIEKCKSTSLDREVKRHCRSTCRTTQQKKSLYWWWKPKRDKGKRWTSGRRY